MKIRKKYQNEFENSEEIQDRQQTAFEAEQERKRKKDLEYLADDQLYDNRNRIQKLIDRQNTKAVEVKNTQRNREFAVVTYFFLTIFLGMIAYFVYFQVEESEAFINSPYNKRQDMFADRIIRGDIVSSQGDVLATTEVSKDGSEVRSYPYGRMYAHAIGYSTNGKTGVESIDNFPLLRSHTFFPEKIFNEMRDKKNIGDTVVTTLDSAVQKAAYDALGNNQGAVIALQPSTGRILAMVSKPDFDPNTIAAEWESLTDESNTSSVLLNRVTQGLYPPGSAFKIFTLMAYMQEHKDYKGYSYPCSGSMNKQGNEIHCFSHAVHGQEDLLTAFANSCNTSFADIGLSLDLKKFAKLNRSLLFDTELPCEFPYQKSRFELKPGAATWDIMQTSIGQGKTLVTPYHMALVMSAIDNNGVLMQPYIVEKVTNDSGSEVSKTEPEKYASLMSEKKSAVLKQYLQAVVTQGTATALYNDSYLAGGKTGSAEFTDASDSHAWFVGFASKQGEEDIVVSIIVEGAGTGSTYAVPIAKAVFDAYFYGQ